MGAVQRMLGLLALLALTGCDEARKADAELNVALANLAQVKAEHDELERKLQDLRKAVPAGSTPEQMAERLMTQATADLARYDQELVREAEKYRVTQASLEALRKGVQALSATVAP